MILFPKSRDTWKSLGEQYVWCSDSLPFLSVQTRFQSHPNPISFSILYLWEEFPVHISVFYNGFYCPNTDRTRLLYYSLCLDRNLSGYFMYRLIPKDVLTAVHHGR